MGLFKSIGKIAGGVGGFVLGGPAGAYAGYKLGDAVTGGGGKKTGNPPAASTPTRRTTRAVRGRGSQPIPRHVERWPGRARGIDASRCLVGDAGVPAAAAGDS
jgi:hypothetical protein